MLKIAITGGAGSGKSAVARMFQELGAAALDADDAARAAVAPGQPAGDEVRAAFGPEYFRADGSLDRARLARLVFSDPEARRRLNGIIHPRVAAAIQAQLEDLARRGVELALVEVPLLFEAGLAGEYDRVIVVDASPADQAHRLQDRDGRPPEEIAGILQAQWSLTDKVARADYVVANSGSQDETRRQVENIWRDLQKILLTERSKKVNVP